MADGTVRMTYWRGVREGLPFLIVMSPFALLFGVVASEAGLTLAETMVMTTVVIAGAAQFTALQLMIEDAATVLVVLAALAVNLRMAMYSAALVPLMGAAPLWQRACASYLMFDQNYAMSAARFEENPNWGWREGQAYYLGVASPLVPMWIGLTFLGARIGAQVPEELALDFAMPITFLAIVAPMLKTLAHLAAALTSIVLALALAFLPTGLGLLVAAFAAMGVGAWVETVMERRT